MAVASFTAYDDVYLILAPTRFSLTFPQPYRVWPQAGQSSAAYCSCVVWAANETTTDVLASGKNRTWQLCTATDAQGNRRPATYSPPGSFAAVVGCCEWEKRFSDDCSIQTSMYCPFGMVTKSGFASYKYSGHCMTEHEMQSMFRVVGIVLGSLFGCAFLYMGWLYAVKGFRCVRTTAGSASYNYRWMAAGSYTRVETTSIRSNVLPGGGQEAAPPKYTEPPPPPSYTPQ